MAQARPGGELIEVVEEEVMRAVFERETRRVGIAALARLAGISTTSVYRVLNGGPLGIALPAALGFAVVRGFRRIGPGISAAVPTPPPRGHYTPRTRTRVPQTVDADAVTSEQEMAEIWGRIDPAAATAHVRPAAAATNGNVETGEPEPAPAKRRPVPVPIPIDEPAPGGADAVEDE